MEYKWERIGRFVYALNEKGVNHFDFNVQGAHTSEEELIRIAKIAQASPDLLKALKDIVGLTKNAGTTIKEYYPCIKQAEQAIAKATNKAEESKNNNYPEEDYLDSYICNKCNNRHEACRCS